MRKECTSQKVNIETYFEEFCGGQNSSSEMQPGSHDIKFHKGNIKLLTRTEEKREILKPYKNNKSNLPMAKELSGDDLKKAEQAIFELSKQLNKEFSEHDEGENMAMLSIEEQPKSRQGNIKWILKVAAVSILISAALDAFPLIMQVCASASTCNRIQTMTLSQIDRVTGQMNGETLNSESLSTDESLFSVAINHAHKAAELTQTAKTTEDWQNVEKYWLKSIQALEQISNDSHLREKVDDRLTIYQRNRSYAREEFDTFREAVNAAEEASEIVNFANGPEEWGKAVEKWREAIELMYMVSVDSPNYQIAQAKLAEYALKFAYAQNSYLDSIGQSSSLSLGQS